MRETRFRVKSGAVKKRQTCGFQGTTSGGGVFDTTGSLEKAASNDLCTWFGVPGLADVADLGDGMLTLDGPGIDNQGLVLVLIHAVLKFDEQGVALARVELAAEDGELDAFAPAAQEFEYPGAAAVGGNVVGDEVKTAHGTHPF
jgi:hypothetical protein